MAPKRQKKKSTQQQFADEEKARRARRVKAAEDKAERENAAENQRRAFENSHRQSADLFSSYDLNVAPGQPGVPWSFMTQAQKRAWKNAQDNRRAREQRRDIAGAPTRYVQREIRDDIADPFLHPSINDDDDEVRATLKDLQASQKTHETRPKGGKRRAGSDAAGLEQVRRPSKRKANEEPGPPAKKKRIVDMVQETRAAQQAKELRELRAAQRTKELRETRVVQRAREAARDARPDEGVEDEEGDYDAFLRQAYGSNRTGLTRHAKKPNYQAELLQAQLKESARLEAERLKAEAEKRAKRKSLKTKKGRRQALEDLFPDEDWDIYDDDGDYDLGEDPEPPAKKVAVNTDKHWLKDREKKTVDQRWDEYEDEEDESEAIRINEENRQMQANYIRALTAGESGREIVPFKPTRKQLKFSSSIAPDNIPRGLYYGKTSRPPRYWEADEGGDEPEEDTGGWAGPDTRAARDWVGPHIAQLGRRQKRLATVKAAWSARRAAKESERVKRKARRAGWKLRRYNEERRIGPKPYASTGINPLGKPWTIPDEPLMKGFWEDTFRTSKKAIKKTPQPRKARPPEWLSTSDLVGTALADRNFHDRFPGVAGLSPHQIAEFARLYYFKKPLNAAMAKISKQMHVNNERNKRIMREINRKIRTGRPTPPPSPPPTPSPPRTPDWPTPPPTPPSVLPRWLQKCGYIRDDPHNYRMFRMRPEWFQDDELITMFEWINRNILEHDRFLIIKIPRTAEGVAARKERFILDYMSGGRPGSRTIEQARAAWDRRATDEAALYFTLSSDNIDDILTKLGAALNGDLGEIEFYGSDEELVDMIIAEKFLIGNPPPRPSGAARAAGQYFPYLHTFSDKTLTETLAEVGLWKTVDPKNYVDNCLCMAMKSCGVNASVMEDLRSSCMLRSIPRYRIREIAERYDLRVEIRTVGTGSVVRVGPETGYPVNLGLYKRHYFHNYDTKYNSWAIKNYDRIYHKMDWWAYYREGQRNYSLGLSTYRLLQLIVNENIHLTPIDQSTHGIFRTQFHDRAGRDFATLEYPEGAVRPTHPPRFAREEIDEQALKELSTLENRLTGTPQGTETLRRLRTKFVRLGLGKSEQLKIIRRHTEPKARIYLDFESTTDGDTHKAYLGCWSVDGDDQIYYTNTNMPGLEFLNWVLDRYGVELSKEVDPDEDKQPLPSVCVIAHNITYDASFLMMHLGRLELVERGTSIICGNGVYRREDDLEGYFAVKLEFKDSQKMIAGTLASFASKFNLEIVKEVMPYDLYTEEFVTSGGWATEEELRLVTPEHDYPLLMTNLHEMGVSDDHGRWDMIHYSRWYCQADVRLLKKGWNVFRDDTLRQVDIDVNFYPTTASLADAYLTEEGCYDGVYEVSGVAREFISRCNIGGRVMCRNNQPQIVEEPLADLDAVSLYPSAMISIPGYLKGKPKVWNPSVNLATADGYFLKVLIKTVPKKWAFPITRICTKEGGNNWTNDLENQVIYVDRPTFEDLCFYSESHDERMDFEVIQGYYYDEGRNTRIQDVMRHLFDVRLELKRIKSSAQEGIKLMMNSAYGKCGLKPIDTNVHYVPPWKSINFLHNHHNHMKHYIVMPNGSYRFETYKPIDVHFNKQHISCEILSWSKRLMNRVMCLAEDMGIGIFYTDTDSMHIQNSKVDELAEEFKRKYQQEMIGNGVGQFHVDFDFKSCFSKEGDTLVRNTKASTGEIVAKKAIFLGKKSYIDHLVDEAGVEAYHVRLKGIPIKCIMSKCNRDYEGCPMKLFDDMFAGNPVDFELGAFGHVMFKTGKDHQVSSEKMTRTIKFNTHGPETHLDSATAT